MQNTLSLEKDVRGRMTRFDPIKPDIVAAYDGTTPSRTPYTGRLPLVAGGLLEEPLLECIETYRAGKQEVPNGF